MVDGGVCLDALHSFVVYVLATEEDHSESGRNVWHIFFFKTFWLVYVK